MKARKEKFDRLLERLRTERDELRVKAHLARAEAAEEWEKLEDKWQELESRAKAARREAREASGDVSSALESLGEELSRAYRRVRNQLR